MRRKDRAITSDSELEAIIHKAKVCRLALSDNDTPYVIPLNFGYHDKTIYFHSAPEGKKIEILKKNNRVCVEFDTDLKLIESEQACTWGIHYRSVIGFGQATFINDSHSKRKALDIIMSHYSVKNYDYDEATLTRTLLFKVNLQQLTGKQSGEFRTDE